MTQNPQNSGNAVAVASPHSTGGGALSVFGNIESFENAQRMAKALASSDLVPETYRNNVGNCIIAMEVASRTGASILAVTQNLHVIQGRPSWGSSFIIAALNSCGRFATMRFDVTDKGKKTVPYEYWEGPRGNRSKKQGKADIEDRECIAWTVPAGVVIPLDVRTLDDARKRNLPVIEGPPVSLEMAVLEGWYTKNDSKWKTMPDLMIRYRAAAFFGRLYAPDVLMGMHTDEEVYDMPEPMRDVTPPKAPVATGPMPAAEVVQEAKPAAAPAAEAKADDAGDDGGPRRRGRPSREELAAAREAGAQACRDGVDHAEVPEDFATPSLTKEWTQGWYEAAAEREGDPEPAEAERVDPEPKAEAAPAKGAGDDIEPIPENLRRKDEAKPAAAPFDPPKDADGASEMTQGDDDEYGFEE